MTLESYITQSKQTQNIMETITIIETAGILLTTPTAFQNGNQHNAQGENSGSCKLFAFAKLQTLTPEKKLACFGEVLYEDVIKNPDGTDHQNIPPNFMKTGWNGIRI
jgi:hypothetical protein